MLVQGFAAFVIAGTAYAAYMDLKTSEVPDSVSLVVGGGAVLFHLFLSAASGSIEPLIGSISGGVLLFALGWMMYIGGMWGGADAFVLGAIGFALPALSEASTAAHTAPWPFAFSVLLTVFLLGSVYSLLYAVYFAMSSEGFVRNMLVEFREKRRRYSFIVLLYTGVAGAGTLAVYALFDPSAVLMMKNFSASLLLLVALLLLSVFLRTVESQVMEFEVPVGDLEEGDVLAEELDLEESREDPVEGSTDRVIEFLTSLLPISLSLLERSPGRIVGLTAGQVEEVQEKEDKVKVKTGVRFIPVFPAAIALILVFGDPLYFLILQLV